jgi:hypothetical protein
MSEQIYDRQFVCYLHLTRWSHVSFGFHIDFWSPNIEIHLPFCFIRVGWQGIHQLESSEESWKRTTFGKDRKRSVSDEGRSFRIVVEPIEDGGVGAQMSSG